MELGNQSSSDNAFTKKYRLHQSNYRANVLKVPAGIGPTKNSKKTYGNMLSNGDVTGLNFISENAFRFAKQKVLDKQINPDLTIDEFRLFNNMLSSMPMCFNLFSDLRTLLLSEPYSASKIIKEMFQELDWIETVTYIDIEFIPRPITAYTNDKSAFDAMILVTDDQGYKGLISIETKYTDLLGSNTAKHTQTKDLLISANKIVDASYQSYLLTNGYQQIHRNYLLTYSFAKKHGYKHFANVVISPKEDSLSVQEIEDFKKHLLLDRRTILKIPLETMVARAIETNDDQIVPVMEKFRERYILPFPLSTNR